MKLGVSHRRENQLTDSHLRYLRQMGVEEIEVRISWKDADIEHLRDIKRTVESAGLGLFEIMLNDLYSAPSFPLDLPERDHDIKVFKKFVEDLGKLEIPNTTYAWYTGGIYKTGETSIRGCTTRDFHLDEVRATAPIYEREYSESDMWASYERFIAEMLPVAEKANVRLQLHPNDPPVDHQGVARIFKSTDAYRRALRIADYSPYSAILFCVGSWAEMAGPDGTGEDIAGAVEEFVKSGHVHQLHFRNVSAPLPDFYETFIEDGYVDMAKIIRVLAENDFQGMLVPDHVPNTDGSDAGPYGTEAYLLGYLRAMIQQARA